LAAFIRRGMAPVIPVQSNCLEAQILDQSDAVFLVLILEAAKVQLVHAN
jgi:hypothetical protein